MSDIFGNEFNSFSGGGDDAEDFDFDRAASAFPDISLDGNIPVAPPMNAGATNSSFLSETYNPPGSQSQPAVKVTGDDELDKFESDFPDISVPEQRSPPHQNLFTPTYAPQPQTSFSTTPILNQAATEEEPEVIREWREKQQEEIKARDEASKHKQEETVQKAERAIEEFYENYSKKKERSIRDNKNAEADYVAELTSGLSQGTTWERICSLVDLQNSQSKTLARTGADTTDLSRFKDVLLRLKREGDTAPGAAGY